MNPPGNELLNQVLQLPTEERTEVAARILESLHAEPQDEVDAAWAAEIQRRVARARAGEGTFASWDTVKQRLKSR